MASRQSYAEVWTFADPTTEFLKAAKATEVTVFKAGTSEKATIYEQREGGSPASNPFISQENGLILFWANTGDYDIKFHDTTVPARFGDFIAGWQSSPVNVEIEAGELSSKGNFIEWSQEGGGAWLPKIKNGSITTTQLASALELPLSALVPSIAQALFTSGDIKPTGRSSAPTGWLLCNGASLLRSEYGTLFSAIGTSFGSADGTHFTLPDLTGRAPIGAGTGAGLTARGLGGKYGLEVVQLLEGHLPSHQHYAGGLYTQISVNESFQVFYDNSGSTFGASGFKAIPNWGNANNVILGYTSPIGSYVPHENMSPVQAINFLIKT